MEKATKSQMMDVDVKKTLLDGFEIQLEDEVSLLTEYTRKFKALFLRFQERCKIAYVFKRIASLTSIFSPLETITARRTL